MSKPGTKEIVPAIRFAGFDEEWVEHELGDVGDFKNGMNFSKDAMGHGYPFVNLQDVFGTNTVKRANLGLAISTEKQRKDYSLCTGDVLFIRSSVKLEGVGEASVITETFYDTTYSGFIIRFRPFRKMAVSFNQFVYATAVVRSKILSSASSSANTNINQTTLQKIKVTFPVFKEQAKVGSYFQELDALIAGHQKKREKLLQIKKSLLEKMFPKQGKDKPEIRFVGFDEKWNCTKFEKLVSRVGNACNDSILPRVEYEDIVSGRGQLNKDVTKKEKTKSGIEFQIGDVLYGKLRPYLKNWLLPDFNGVAVGDFWVLRTNEFNRELIFYLLQTEGFDKVANQSVGSKMPRADWRLVSKSYFSVPKTSQEQTKIGQLLKYTDTLITQHQSQISKLNNIKQACLAQMFV